LVLYNIHCQHNVDYCKPINLTYSVWQGFSVGRVVCRPHPQAERRQTPCRCSHWQVRPVEFWTATQQCAGTTESIAFQPVYNVLKIGFMLHVLRPHVEYRTSIYTSPWHRSKATCRWCNI